MEMSTFRSCKTNSTASLGLFLSAALTIAIACGMAWTSNIKTKMVPENALEIMKYLFQANCKQRKKNSRKKHRNT